MIGRVHKPGTDLSGLLRYLFGPGRRNEHVNPRVVGGWRHPAELEPPRRPDGTRDFAGLTGLMEIPLALLDDQAPDEYVYHVSVRAADADPDLGDGAWMRIAAEVMDRTGLSPRGQENQACPWIAVHHGDNHVHIVAVLARQDARSYGGLHNDFYRIHEALAEVEKEYGLEVTPAADRTANCRPTPAELEKAAAAGRDEPPRVTLQRQVAAARAAACSENEFFANLEERDDILVRIHRSAQEPAKIDGYAVGLPGDCGKDGQQIWFAGSHLAPDLSLVKLRRRWQPGPAEHPHRASEQFRARGHGHGPDLSQKQRRQARLSPAHMNSGSAKAALLRQVQVVASNTSCESEFFAGLNDAGLLVKYRLDPDQPRGISGYAVSLPGLLHYRDHEQWWFGGHTLHPSLGLGALRSTWAGGRSRAPSPRPGLPHKTGDTAAIYSYVTFVAQEAAREIGSASGRNLADIAWATSDVLIAAAEATGNSELGRAADGFSRAGRCAWGRTPPPSELGMALRTAAWLLSRAGPCDGTGQKNRTEQERERAARAALITALAGLARAVAQLRAAQSRLGQAQAAGDAAAGLEAAGLHDRVSVRAGPVQVRQRSDRTGRRSGPSQQADAVRADRLPGGTRKGTRWTRTPSLSARQVPARGERSPRSPRS